MNTKAAQLAQFNPNGVGVAGSLFALPYTPETADIVIIPVPWEVTVSYSPGTAQGPQAILEASTQIDYDAADLLQPWTLGIAMLPIAKEWEESNQKHRTLASHYIDWLEQGQPQGLEEWAGKMALIPPLVNTAAEQLNRWVASQAGQVLQAGKIPAVLGGDHSTPYGLIQALTLHHESFGILQIDAHADLRPAYEGFTYSHASIMHNVLQHPQISHLVQVGIRDWCPQERERWHAEPERIHVFLDQDIQESAFQGTHWAQYCTGIVEKLPQKVYISFDIDGLSPDLCPNTGTPVPGGLSFQQAAYLIKQVALSGRQIIGFDLVEVANGPQGDWDANVGARMLWRLATLTGASQGHLMFA